MIRLGVPLLILASALTSVQSQNSTEPSALTSCKGMPEHLLVAYLGWPVLISCENLHKLIPIPEKMTFQGMLTTCIIRSLPSTEIVGNVTIPQYQGWFPTETELKKAALQLNVTDDLATNYLVKLEIGNMCWYQVVELNKSSAPSSGGCSGSEVVSYSATLNNTHTMPCEVPPFLYLVEEDLIWRWTFNCDETLPSNILNQDTKSASMNKVNFENVGTYVCFVQYRGKELALTQFDVCLKYVSEISDPIEIKCPTEVRAQLGRDATINCVSDVSAGKANRLYINGIWYRKQNLTQEYCDSVEGEIKNSTIEAEGNRVQCSMNSSLEEDKCHKSRPPEGQQHDIYTITLTIKNLQPSDFGDYVFVHRHLVKTYNRTVTLVIDDTAQTKAKIAGFSVGAVLLLLVIIAAVICIRKKKDIKWYLKKHYGPCDKEFFTYTAYFAYYYDFERGEESMKKTKSLVQNLHSFMNKFGGTVYDDARDHNVHQFDVDNIVQIQSDCHRIILLITPEFLLDEWSRLKQHHALAEVIESGRKVIFITFPETKKAIEGLDDSPRTAIVSAMKRNIKIKWDGKLPFNGKFKRRLEYALPKLPKPAYSRFLSDSSQAQLTHLNRYAARSDKESTSDYSNGFSCVV